MFKRIAFVLSLLLFIPAFVLTGCKGKGDNNASVYNTDFKISASAQEDEISLEISNVNKPRNYSNGDQLDVVMLKPYEYYKGEADIGIFEGTDKADLGTVVGQYTVGNSATLKIDRYSEDCDQLYNKFVLSKNGNLVAGPFYVSQIQSLRNFEQKTVVSTKKGLLGQVNEITRETGCGWTEYNLMLNAVVFPNEKYGPNGEEIPIDNSHLSESEAEAFEFNGKTFYINKTYINQIDENLLYCKANNIKVLLIVINDIHYASDFMAYKTMASNAKLAAFNTSTEKGMEYFTVAMEYLAERYSREDGEFGWSHRYVIGNEIDLSYEWNPVLDYSTQTQLKLNNYVEEYLRTLRLADQALKKYYKDSMVIVSTTHHWTAHADVNGCYSPYDIYNTLNEKTSYSGNFNWGLAGHNYPKGLSETIFMDKESKDPAITGDFKTTQYITWTNLEVYNNYLSQEKLLFNGQLRRLYLTEGGVSSGSLQNELGLASQAAGIAYAYYKTVNLPCTDAFIYYKQIDTPEDGGGLNFGLYKKEYPNPDSIKPSYEVFKYIDTQYSFVVANKYLNRVAYYKNNVRYSHAKGNITCYRDAMDICGSNFNWEVNWKEENIITRQVETIPEYESQL